MIGLIVALSYSLAADAGLQSCRVQLPQPVEQSRTELVCSYARCPELPTEIAARWDINLAGKAENIEVSGGDELLHRTVHRALRGWRWNPEQACRGASHVFALDWDS